MKKLFDNTAEYRHRCRSVLEHMYPIGYIENDNQFFYYYNGNMYCCTDVYTHAEYTFNLETGCWDMTGSPQPYYEQIDALSNFMEYIASIAPEEIAKSVSTEIVADADLTDEERNLENVVIDSSVEAEIHEGCMDDISITKDCIPVNMNPSSEDVQVSVKNIKAHSRFVWDINIFLRLMEGIHENIYTFCLTTEDRKEYAERIKQLALKTGMFVYNKAPIYDIYEFARMSGLRGHNEHNVDQAHYDNKLTNFVNLDRLLKSYNNRQNSFSPKHNCPERGCDVL